MASFVWGNKEGPVSFPHGGLTGPATYVAGVYEKPTYLPKIPVCIGMIGPLTGSWLFYLVGNPAQKPDPLQRKWPDEYMKIL